MKLELDAEEIKLFIEHLRSMQARQTTYLACDKCGMVFSADRFVNYKEHELHCDGHGGLR